MTRIHVLMIDPQNDFCDPKGSLFVKGADEDMQRLAAMVRRLCDKIDDIHVTLDSHQIMQIFHPDWWKDSSGNHPTPFTLISPADVESRRWSTSIVSAEARSLAYLRALATGGRYPHVIWPRHCLIGSWGCQIHPDLLTAVYEWEAKRRARVNFVVKGNNPFTEHFSGVQAEVPDPTDPTTQINTGLIQTLQDADIILLAGEARSHCLANTGRDVVSNFSDPRYIEKVVLLTDACSDVPTFEQFGEQFVRDLTAMGMKLSTTAEYLR